MKIAITSESAIDLSKQVYEEFDIKMVDVPVFLGKKQTTDLETDCDQIFDFYNQNKILPKTAAPNIFDYQKFFNSLLQQGYERIIHVAMSSCMSSSFSNAQTAAKSFDGRVSVVDARTCSTGVGILCVKAREMINDGHSIEETVDVIQKRAYYVESSFIFENVEYLYAAGRCNLIKKWATTLLHLRPETHVDTEKGRLVLGKFFRGKLDKCVLNYTNSILERFPNQDKSLAFMTYTTMDDEIVDAVYNRLKEVGFKRVEKQQARSAVAINTGPHTMGVIFINDDGVKY